jgi:hypothetical protein
MTRWLRFVLTFLRALFRPKAQLQEEQTLQFWTWVTEADLSYINNSSLLVYFELGRIDFLCRSGLVYWCVKSKIFPVIASGHLNFLRPLKRFQKLELRSRIVFWDENWIWMEQNLSTKIRGESKPVSKFLLKVAFRKDKSRYSVFKVLEGSGLKLSPMIKPECITKLENIE